MTPKRQLGESARRTRRVVYVVVGLYLGVGALLAICATFASAPIGVCLGLLIIGAAVAAIVGFHRFLRLDADLDALREHLDRIRTELGKPEKARDLGTPRAGGGHDEASARADQTVLVDLTAFGRGDPTPITAATLEGSTFPRLARALDRLPRFDQKAESAAATAGTMRDLLHTWRVALREGDLVTCRTVLSSLLSSADPDMVVTLAQELRKLTHRTELSLRTQFSKCIRVRDYAGALRVGDRILAELPDSPVAREFARLKPHLLRRVAGPDDTEDDPRAFAQGT